MSRRRAPHPYTLLLRPGRAGLALALLFAASPALATPRALFDNTHAETAGNADWIIDTHQPLPLPDQSTVGAATPRIYWLGAISSWGIDLVKRGYEVATLAAPNTISYGDTTQPYDLSRFDVFIVPEPNTLFSAAESTAVFEFVEAGGGLIAVGDHWNSDRNGDGWDSPEIWNALDAQGLWGVHWSIQTDANNNIVQDSGNEDTTPADSIVHGPVGIADSLSFHNGSTFTLTPADNPQVRGVFWMNGLAHGSTGVMAARSEYGNGRIFFLGDSSPIDDGSAQPGNSSIYDGWGEAAGRDSILVMNATLWATRRAPDLPLAAPPAPPARLALAPPSPNPSRGVTTLRWSLATAADGTLELRDVAGRRVRTLARGTFAAGEHAQTWDGRDATGRPVPPGLYFARLVAAGGQRSQRIVRF